MDFTEFKNPLHLDGVNSQAVFDLIKSRTCSPCEKQKDGRKLLIVAEGGAMRGVVSAGVLSGLACIGSENIFDSIFKMMPGCPLNDDLWTETSDYYCPRLRLSQ